MVCRLDATVITCKRAWRHVSCHAAYLTCIEVNLPDRSLTILYIVGTFIIDCYHHLFNRRATVRPTHACFFFRFSTSWVSRELVKKKKVITTTRVYIFFESNKLSLIDMTNGWLMTSNRRHTLLAHTYARSQCS